MRAGELLGRVVHDRQGRRLGQVVDLVVTPAGADRRCRLVAVVVVRHWVGRLIGPESHCPPSAWPVRLLVRLLRRPTRRIPLAEVRFRPPVPALP